MIVEVLCRPGCRRLPVWRIRRLVEEILRLARRRADQVSILLTRDSEMRTLNRRFRRLDRPTDVLSFPASAGFPRGGHLGDIAISVETAARHARAAGWTLAEEIQFLILHGLLHLMGHDHETDRGEMERLQSRLSRRLWGRDVPQARTSGAIAGRGGPRRGPAHD